LIEFRQRLSLALGQFSPGLQCGTGISKCG
jgi:hypothetical protein